MDDGAQVGRSPSEKLAIAGLIVLAVAVSLVPGRVAFGPLPFDAVTVTVPLAVVLSLPFMRRLGHSRVPGLLVEVPALAFVAVALLGALFAQGRGEVLLTLTRYVFYLLLAVCVAAVAVRPANRRALAWVVAGVSVVSVAYAFWQFFRAGADVSQFGVSAEIGARVTSALGNPNPYAEYLVMAFAIVLSLALTERGYLRWLAAAVCAAQTVALVLTFTRGSWLALGVGILAASLIVGLRWSAAFLAGGAALVVAIPGALARLASLTDEKGGIADRLSLWRVAGEMIRRHPFVGVGLGRYLPALAREVAADPSILPAGVRPYTAHNSFLMVTAETGLAGGAAFAWMVLRTVRTCGVLATRLERGSREWASHAAYTVGIVAFAANAVTINTFQHPRSAVMFWLLFGLMTANGAAALASGAPDAAGPFAVLWRVPRTRGRLLLDAAAGRLLLGEGAVDAPDVEAWEVVRS